MPNWKKRKEKQMGTSNREWRQPRHPAFEGDRKAEVQRQHGILKDVYIADYDSYEMGFRGDTNPDREIHTWRGIADGYRQFAGREASVVRRQAIFDVVFLTRLTGLADFHRQPKPDSLNLDEIKRIADYMYYIYGDATPLSLVVGAA